MNHEQKESVKANEQEHEWQNVKLSKYNNPDVLIVGNSNVGGLDPRFIKPLYTMKHLLEKKNIRGALDYLKHTIIKPKRAIIIQAIDNDICVLPTENIMQLLKEIHDLCKSKYPNVELFVLEPLGRYTSKNPQLYWNKATTLCSSLSSLDEVCIIKTTPKMKV